MLEGNVEDPPIPGENGLTGTSQSTALALIPAPGTALVPLSSLPKKKTRAEKLKSIINIAGWGSLGGTPIAGILGGFGLIAPAIAGPLFIAGLGTVGITIISSDILNVRLREQNQARTDHLHTEGRKQLKAAIENNTAAQGAMFQLTALDGSTKIMRIEEICHTLTDKLDGGKQTTAAYTANFYEIEAVPGGGFKLGVPVRDFRYSWPLSITHVIREPRQQLLLTHDGNKPSTAPATPQPDAETNSGSADMDGEKTSAIEPESLLAKVPLAPAPGFRPAPPGNQLRP